MHEKWHVAQRGSAARAIDRLQPAAAECARAELDIPTNHADLIPTLLGLTGIDPDQALARLRIYVRGGARPLVGRDLLAGHPRHRPGRAHRAGPAPPPTMRSSKGSATAKSPFGRVARACTRSTTIKQTQTTCRPSSLRLTSTASGVW